MKSIFKDTKEDKIDKKIKLEEKIIEKLFQYQKKVHAQYRVGFPDTILQNRYREPVS